MTGCPLRYFIGLDLGQAQDPTALAVLERPHVLPHDPPSLRRPAYALRHLRRFGPGTPYPAITAAVRELLQTPPLPGSVVAVDKTGVGQAVMELLFDGLRGQVDCRAFAVTITAGKELGGDLQVPKKELVGTLQVLLQTRRLSIPRGLPEAALLVKELENFRARVVLTKVDAVEAWREGQHDDLVLALALAAWLGELALPPLWEEPEEPMTVLRAL